MVACLPIFSFPKLLLFYRELTPKVPCPHSVPLLSPFQSCTPSPFHLLRKVVHLLSSDRAYATMGPGKEQVRAPNCHRIFPGWEEGQSTVRGTKGASTPFSSNPAFWAPAQNCGLRVEKLYEFLAMSSDLISTQVLKERESSAGENISDILWKQQHNQFSLLHLCYLFLSFLPLTFRRGEK